MINHASQIQSILKRYTARTSLFLAGIMILASLASSFYIVGKESTRRVKFEKSIKGILDYQTRTISEEMWTKNYESIDIRFQQIMEDIGSSNSNLILLDDIGDCVLSGHKLFIGEHCKVGRDIRKKVANHRDGDSTLIFANEKKKYQYFTPLYVGQNYRGFFFAQFSDPYDFIQDNYLIFALKIFLAMFLSCLGLFLIWNRFGERNILTPLFRRLTEVEKVEALGKLASKHAHDLEPLRVAVRTLRSESTNLTELQSKVLHSLERNLSSTISGLRTNYGKSSNPSQLKFSIPSEVIRSAVDVESSKFSTDEIEIIFRSQRDLEVVGVEMASEDVARVVRNIVTNSTHAKKVGEKLKIDVTLSKVENYLEIVISDNGIGMSERLLREIKKNGGTHNKKNGSGLGLEIVKELVEEGHGTFDFTSKEMQGTRSTIRVPVASPPEWFATKFEIDPNRAILILEDCPNIANILKDRLREYEVHHITHPCEYSNQEYPKEKFQKIFDVHLRNSSITGLDLVRQNELQDEDILILTSYHEDLEVQASVQKLGCRLMPKFLAADAPIVESKKEKLAKRNGPDLYLIDDDRLVHTSYEFFFSGKGRNVKCFYDFESFREYRESNKNFDFSTPVAVDKNLANEESGVDVLVSLHKENHTSLWSVTGDTFSKDEKSRLHFLKGFLDKSPREEIFI